MLATILIIAGFQVYWLNDNYNREKEILEVRANSLFHETVRQVQDSLVQQKLLLVLEDSIDTAAGLKRNALRPPFKKSLPDPLHPARVLKLLSKKLLNDSLDNKGNSKKELHISINENEKYNAKDNTGNFHVNVDSLHTIINEVYTVDTREKVPGQSHWGDTLNINGKPRNKMLSITQTEDGDSNQIARINTIYFNNEKGVGYRIKIDSLFNDSIPIPVLEAAVAKVFKLEKLELPFIILRQQEEMNVEEEAFVRKPMFGSFAGYKLQLGNTFPYLIKEILLPILFSIFLVGVTIFSFIILYRSLLRQYRLGLIKNDLISNITHELKTPIATVSVAIEALRNFSAAQSPEKNKEYLDISASELQRLSLLVDKVLKISLLENKRIELKKESFNIRELVQEVLSIMKLQFEKHHAQVRVNTAGDNFVIGADRLHITSIIYNLLDNALKYTRGNPVIDVLVSSLPNDIIELKVSDNGIGISKEYQARIFDKFFRVPAGDTHNIKGYGMGLSYVKEILKAYMGFISVESEPGKGSTFSVKLPFKVAPVIYLDDKRRIFKKDIKL